MKPATIRDLHVYGGAVLFSAGAAVAHAAAGLVVFGVFLTFLGLFWRGPRG